ncbi:MAG: hypothetical protein IJQ10_00910 [Clostridia bacterium]|jgi:hypothetical protein|nr:hypothetical protein [Clostridia bacterium]
MNMSQPHGNSYYVNVESEAGSFAIFASIRNCGFELYNGDKRFSFSNITGN